MRILELTNYSAGGCGVGARAMREAALLAEQGHEVRIFSSNLVKGSDQYAPEREQVGQVQIRRFPGKRLGGESFLNWRFEKEALAFEPEVIIVHAYRHLHTTRALKIARELRAKIFLVPHAPFARNETRTRMQRWIVSMYDSVVGRASLKKFDRVLAITKWEIPFLLSLGVPKEKLAYIPNGIQQDFFDAKKKFSEKNTLLYIGRVSPIKDIEAIIRAMPHVNPKYRLEIYGPAEANYLDKLKILVTNLNLQSRVSFIIKTYGLSEQINEFDKARMFILASKSEGMPQVLVEALARGKLVVASDNPGNKDIIANGKNGFLFNKGDERDLAKKISQALSLKVNQREKMRKSAIKSVSEYTWKKSIKKLTDLIYENTNN